MTQHDFNRQARAAKADMLKEMPNSVEQRASGVVRQGSDCGYEARL
jgi:hypothetical protein